MSDRFCEWCGGPILATARSDARTCKKACRQALHRFRVAPAASAAGGDAMRFGYADPPYPGLAEKYYDHDPRCAEVDHVKLIADLHSSYPHGWALSTSASALQHVLGLCPTGVRVAIWIKGSRPGVSWRARNAYEPVILYGGRAIRRECNEVLDDVLAWGGRQHSHPDALVGMKPAAFAEWLFLQLGALAGDYLTDLFPGSGAIMRAWKQYGGRDPNEQTSILRLPFGDIVTAPPRARGELPSRFAEAVERSDASLVDERPEGERDG